VHCVNHHGESTLYGFFRSTDTPKLPPAAGWGPRRSRSDFDQLLISLCISWFTRSGPAAAQFIHNGAHTERDWASADVDPRQQLITVIGDADADRMGGSSRLMIAT
jgi:hypothetical protein